MRTFKFLAKGARGPFSGQPWTTEWRAIDGELELGRHGFHVCRPEDLAFWLHDELWEVEIGGAILEGTDCVVAERARLLRRISRWDADGAKSFADACILHAAEGNPHYIADAKMAVAHGYAAVAAYAAARATGDIRAERIWQSSWLAKEIVSDA